MPKGQRGGVNTHTAVTKTLIRPKSDAPGRIDCTRPYQSETLNFWRDANSDRRAVSIPKPPRAAPSAPAARSCTYRNKGSAWLGGADAGASESTEAWLATSTSMSMMHPEDPGRQAAGFSTTSKSVRDKHSKLAERRRAWSAGHVRHHDDASAIVFGDHFGQSWTQKTDEATKLASLEAELSREREQTRRALALLHSIPDARPAGNGILRSTLSRQRYQTSSAFMRVQACDFGGKQRADTVPLSAAPNTIGVSW